MAIARNTSYLTLAFIIQKILVFLYIPIIARNIGTEMLGKYFFALSFTTIFSIFIDAGLNPILIRETAKYKDKANKYINAVLTLKFFFSFVTLFAVWIITNILGFDFYTRSLIYIASIVMLFDSFTLNFYALLRSRQILKYESFGVIGYQILTVSLGVMVLLTTKSVGMLIACLAIASFANFIYSGYWAIKITKIRIKFISDKKFFKYLAMSALPFLLAGIFNRVYTHIDIVLISKLIGDAYTGWYGVANRLTFSLQFIPAAFIAAIYPAMSSYFEHSKEKLKEISEKSIIYLMFIIFPISFGAIALGREIILFFYGNKFENSIMPLQLLMVSLIFVFLYYPIGSLLNASNRQKMNTANMGIAMAVNVALNFILIPKFYLIGAATASIASQFLMFIFGLYQANKIVKFNKKLLITKFVQHIITVSIMAAGVFFAKQFINWMILIPTSAVFYFYFLYLIGGISKQDISKIIYSIRRS
ncbi:MAG: flippase [Patescibacteria group bacterium]|nr:flippase [Patescibacteria group bacterium]